MEVFNFDFLKFNIFDVIDIVLVAFLIYQIYNLIRGTIAVNISIGLAAIYLLWLLVRSLNMHLLSTILDKVIGVGVIALIIVFQQEIRRFLLIIGKNTLTNSALWKFFFKNAPIQGDLERKISIIIDTAKSMSNERTGALIVFAKTYEEQVFTNNGEMMNALISRRLLETIFSKNSPLHDGAVIIADDVIKAAGCILPLAENTELPKQLGLRHRAAVGITEQSDAFAIVISEETGKIGFATRGKLKIKTGFKELEDLLREQLHN